MASRERFYHPELDVLRFFAFLAVFLHHALPSTVSAYVALGVPRFLARWIVAGVTSGGYGVDLFFVLSSYLITELLVRERAQKGAIDVASFYVRRILRIWPLYYVFLVTVILVEPLLLPGQGLEAPHRLSFAVFLANWSCAFFDYPASAAALLWSISIEEQFYVAWPLMLSRLPTRRSLVVAAMTLLGVATLTRAWLSWRGVEHPGVWCNTAARLDPIACGALLSVALAGRAPRLGRSWRVAGLGIGTATWVAVARHTELAGPSSLVGYPLVALASVLMVASVLHPTPDAARVAGGPLVYLGQISYGLYVFHVFALELAGRWLAPLKDPMQPLWWVPRSLVGLALTVAVSAASYRWLELPFLRLKERFTRVPSRPA